MKDNGLSRREFAAAIPALVAGVSAIASAQTGGTVGSAAAKALPLKPKFAYVGCYTSKDREARGKGIVVYRIEASGEWKQLQVLESLNPSFLAFDRREQYLYSVHGDVGFVTSYKVNKQTGLIEFLNQQPTGGKNGVHLSFDSANRFLLTANYATGTVTSFDVLSDGSIGPMRDSVSLPGAVGPHRSEQVSSQPHHIPFDPAGRFVIVPDKGVDRIFVFRLDTKGKLLPATPPFVTSRSGSGPRHVEFHPTLPVAYVINELNSTITTYSYNSETGELRPLQIVPMLPESFFGDSKCSEIAVAPSGRFVYGSNRGHESITILSVDQKTGFLTPIGWEPSQGKQPRFFVLQRSGSLLHVCNQATDSIVEFRVDEQTGRLTATGQVIKTGSPVCIAFAYK